MDIGHRIKYSVPAFEVNHFSGIDNVSKSVRAEYETDTKHYIFPLEVAVNVLIDDKRAIESRKGFSLEVSGTDIHSLWADEKNCFFCDGTSLYELTPDFDTILIRQGLTRARMVYVPVNDKVYYSNGFEMGYIRNHQSYTIEDPQISFKSPLFPGRFMDYHKGRLYIAVQNILYVSDPLAEYFDIRSGWMIFNSNIRMVRAVERGIYVADEKTWFINLDDEPVMRKASDETAVEYTDVSVIGAFGFNEKIAIWTSPKGICVGRNDGVVENITERKYLLTEKNEGCAFISESNNVKHYINTLI